MSGGPPYNAYKNPQKKHKGQNRPSEIRFTGVPPIMPIKTPKNQKKKGIPPIMPIKTQKMKGKIDPQKYVYQEKKQIQKNKGQNRPSEIRLSGVPPIMPIKKKQKNNVKKDPQKYVYQGSHL